MNFKQFYSKINEPVLKNYEEDIDIIRSVDQKLINADIDDKYKDFLKKISSLILKFHGLEKVLSDKFFEERSFDELKELFNGMSTEILPENYSASYANPSFTVQTFGKDPGKILYAVYQTYRNYREYAFEHKIFQMHKYNKMFLEIFDLFNKDPEDIADELSTTVKRYFRQINEEALKLRIRSMFDKDLTYTRDVVVNSNPDDLRYMFKYNTYITENEIKTADFFKDYPSEKLDTLALQIAKAYEKGFENNNKTMKGKSTVMIRCQVGHEELIKRLVVILKEKYSLDSLISAPASTPPNKQLGHDHKFTNALYLDENFAKNSVEITRKSWEASAEYVKEYSGIFAVIKFGEKPFSPDNKEEAWSLSPEQQKLYQHIMIQNSQIQQKYMPRTENSFCIVGFPSPEIGENFEKIFEDTLEINMLESEKFEMIQKNIIDVLDKADYVHIKGQNGNLTNIRIKNQELKDPSKHTNYSNCGADVNIPVGEVFTSPKLEGTEGTLHIKETFLGGLRYDQLKLDFKDGWISGYSCANYDDEKKNSKFIEQNLIFPHSTLPIGEFAIGTNTLAYVAAQKYKILDVLPVLIIEKMGPHFAIGDTCYSHTEDMQVFNPVDNKKITAKDNSKSVLRKEDFSKAYTNVHTDITLPYEDIEFITAVTKEGERLDIIRDGRFAVPGTEELNIPLDEFGI